jgi:DNA-binding transcriptional MerR regulator
MSKRVTPKGIAERTLIHPNTVRNWMDRGLIEGVKDFQGRRWFPNPSKTIKEIQQLLNGEKVILDKK